VFSADCVVSFGNPETWPATVNHGSHLASSDFTGCASGLVRRPATCHALNALAHRARRELRGGRLALTAHDLVGRRSSCGA
jgi:hypothetical protein